MLPLRTMTQGGKCHRSQNKRDVVGQLPPLCPPPGGGRRVDLALHSGRRQRGSASAAESARLIPPWRRRRHGPLQIALQDATTAAKWRSARSARAIQAQTGQSAASTEGAVQISAGNASSSAAAAAAASTACSATRGTSRSRRPLSSAAATCTRRR